MPRCRDGKIRCAAVVGVKAVSNQWVSAGEARVSGGMFDDAFLKMLQKDAVPRAVESLSPTLLLRNTSEGRVGERKRVLHNIRHPSLA